MKKSFLLLTVCIALSVFFLFYFQPSKAENQFLNEISALKQSELFSNQPTTLRPITQMIKNYKTAGLTFERRDLFQTATGKVADDEPLREVVSDGETLNLDKRAVRKILREKPESFTLTLPDGKGGTLELELAKVNIFADGFSVKTSKPTKERFEEDLGVHYRGIVKGNNQSLAAISIFTNEVMGFYSTDAEGNWVLGRLGGSNPDDRHILYAERDLKVSSDFICHTKDDNITLPKSLLPEPDEIMARCIRIYLEANYDLYLNKGSVGNVNRYLIGLFNQSATLYSQATISITISEIFVWNTPSPYVGTNAEEQIVMFKAVRPTVNGMPTFNGNLAHLLTLQYEFGGLAGRNGLCGAAPYAFTGLRTTYLNVPMYSWSVSTFTHEIGHNLGSPHTHACAWNGNDTAIDSCAPTEGICSDAPLPPPNGGTIMSYCDRPDVGINFTLGFGDQPRNLVANTFNTAPCLGDCGGPCVYELNPPQRFFSTAGGAGTFDVGTGSNCSWTANAVGPGNWLTLTAWNGIGSGTVNYTVAPNTGPSLRTGVIYVYPQGVYHVVSQYGTDQAGIVQFSSPAYSVNESEGTVTITVTRTGGIASFGVGYSTSNLTAAAGSDYTATSGTLIFASGETSKTFTIPIIDDSISEGSETVFLTLALPLNTSATLGTPRTAILTITDNEFPGISISDVSLNEGSSGTTNFTFNVTLSNPSDSTVMVSYETVSGTATAGSDFVANSGVVTFNPNETSKPVTVSVLGDTAVEPNEIFTVNLFDPVNATIADIQGVGTIINDDACSYLINPTRKDFRSGGGSGTVNVIAPGGCQWTVVSDLFGASDSFIADAILSGSPPVVGLLSSPQTVFKNSLPINVISPNAITTNFPTANTTSVSWITVTSPGSGDGNGTIQYSVAPNTTAAHRTGTMTIATQRFTVTQSSRTPFDYDGDDKADISVFRPPNGDWYISNSSNGSLRAIQFGANGDLIAPADFDNDGKTDISVFRPSNGSWYRLNSFDNTFSGVQFGADGDIPVPGDYDGDGKANLAVFRPSAGSWYIARAAGTPSQNFDSIPFGIVNDKPIADGDFDGDGKADVAVFRPSNGYWYRLNSSNGQFVAAQFGVAEDKPVAADYDGDGKTDLAVFRPSNGYWYVINSSNNSFAATQFGISEDKPSPADFDGDGKDDRVVFRPSNGTWYLLRTTAGFSAAQFGTNGDVPTPNAFVR